MIVITIILGMLLLAFLILEIKVYRILSKCLKIQSEGKVFVEVVADRSTKGWVLERDLLALQNNVRSREEHIRVETKDLIDLVQIRSIKEIRRVKSIRSIIIGNL